MVSFLDGQTPQSEGLVARRKVPTTNLFIDRIGRSDGVKETFERRLLHSKTGRPDGIKETFERRLLPSRSGRPDGVKETFARRLLRIITNTYVEQREDRTSSFTTRC